MIKIGFLNKTNYPYPQIVSKSSPSNSVTSDIEAGLDSLEKQLGFKDDQLRDLMELELPVPQEDKSTGKVMDGEEKEGKVFKLPELKEFLRESSNPLKETQSPLDMLIPANYTKIDRKNLQEYRRFLESNPYADSDERYFTKEVKLFLYMIYFGLKDIFSSFFH